jgi:hypothetical protein
MIKQILMTMALALLLGCNSSPSVSYISDYTAATDDNRAVLDTQEALDTDDVIDTLATMLGSPDQTNTVIASNVRFVHNMEELDNPAYKHYDIRIADNIRMDHDMKDGYVKESAFGLRFRVEEIKDQHPHAVVALNKEDKVIAVALDSLEAQALAQKSPRVFYVLKGQTLKHTINRWAKQSDWTMEWDLKRDYTMVAPATIFGEFSTQGGSLDQLLGTLRHLDQPLKAQFTRNKLVVIRENTYNSSIMAVMP